MELINKKQKVIIFIMYTGIFLISCLFIYFFISKSIGIVPLMDYWKNSALHIEKIMSGNIIINDIFPLPHELHWNPFFNLMDCLFVRIFKCNNKAYIYSGMIIHFAIIIFIIIQYKKQIGNKNCFIDLIGLVLCLLSVINFNQWEILTLYCYFQFMARMFLYLLMFYCIDSFVKGKKGYIESIVIGLACLLIILCVSQAYFFGFVASICGVLLFDLFEGRKKDTIVRYLIIIIFNFIGTVIYILTLSKSPSVNVNVNGLLSICEKYIKGLLLMLGASVVPIEKSTVNINYCYSVGIMIMGLSIIAIFLYFKCQLYKKAFFPIACIVYAFVSIITIIYGRADVFGIESVVASRYVVETTIGLLGIIQIFWMLLNITQINFIKKIIICCIGCIIGSVFIWCDIEQLNIAPYRKAYNDSMTEIVLDIENVTDDELAIFQAPADDVRAGVEVMKKYNLNVFDYNVSHELMDEADDDIIKISGMYDDGWVEKDCSFRILLNEGEDIKFDYTCFEEQSVKVIVDNEEVETVKLKTDEHQFIIDCNEDGWCKVELISDYEAQLQHPDERICSYILSDIDHMSY